MTDRGGKRPGSGPVARWRRLPPGWRDAVGAGALVAVAQVELLASASDVQGPLVLQHLVFAEMAAALALRRTRPLAAALLVAAGMTIQTFLGEAPAAAGYLALMVVVYSVATYCPALRRSLLGLVALLASALSFVLVADDVRVADEVVNAAIPTALWLLARIAWQRQERAVRAERARVEQQQTARERRAEAIADERRRIARELHDTVAHGVTLMLLQSEVVRPQLADAQPLDVVQEAGRACLDDLRRLLVVLRADGGPVEDADVGLDDLISRARQAGVQIEVRAPDGPVALPADAAAGLRRVVQESLTNAMRHAPGSPVDVTWSVAEGVLDVQVRDQGGTASRPGDAAGAGTGLTGLAERVHLLAGSLSTGPREDGPGWLVHARLPVAARVG